MLILLVLNLFLLANHCKGQGNAEVELALSQAGLNYAAGVALDVLAKDILNKQIPDITGSASLTNIKIVEFTKPSAQLQLNAGVGVTASLQNAYIRVNANWRWEKKILFIKLSDSGTVSASSGASISLFVRVSSSGGKPTVEAYSCSANLPNLNIRVGGSWTSIIYNWILSLFTGRIKSLLQDKICESARNVINGKGAQELNTLTLQARVNKYLTIDYSLSKAPYFSASFLKSYHKGTFLNDIGTSQAPPPMNTPTDKMVGLSISENVFNSACRVVYIAGAMKYTYNISNWSDLKNGLPFLTMNEVGGPFELIVYANRAPTTAITSRGITISLSGEVDVVSKAAGQTPTRILNVKFLVDASAAVQMTTNVLKGSVNRIVPTIVQVTPPMAGNVSEINRGILELLDMQLPSINQQLDGGMALPSLTGVSFSDTSLSLDERYLKASSNVRYSG